MLFRDRDKVLLTETTAFHCNGDVGVLGLKEGYTDFSVNFDGVDWPFSPEELALFDLAYCLTIHKSQGSQYDTVIVPVLREFSVMLTRNLLYTAVSRAKRRLVIVGDEDMVRKALLTPPRPRYSALAERVRGLERRLAG